MVYIRNKTVKGIDYAYLVTSSWEPDKKRSKQQTIKYLGRADRVNIESVPVEYRDDPRILSFISHYSPKEKQKREALVNNARALLARRLFEADADSAEELYHSTKDALSLEEFFNGVLRPVMIDIGNGWAQGEVSIAEEHVCTNTASALVRRIRENIRVQNKLKKILLCVPEGELHSLACAVLESVLGGRGYYVANMAPSAPTDSVLSYAAEMQPDLIMVSVTLPDSIGAARRLVKHLSAKVNCPILVGGQAFQGSIAVNGATVVDSRENSLADIQRIVGSMI